MIITTDDIKDMKPKYHQYCRKCFYLWWSYDANPEKCPRCNASDWGEYNKK